MTGSTSLTIADGAVTAAKIATNTITADKIATNAVNTGEIVDGAVTADKIASQTITANKIAANAVNTSEITDGAVTAAKLASGVQTTINNNTNNRVITATGTANTLNGEANLTWDGYDLDVLGGNSSMRMTVSNNTPKINFNANNVADAGRIQLSESSGGGVMLFSTKTTGGSFGEKVRIQTNGGISFNGDTAAGNALDDYEEGTWSPVAGVAGTTNGVGSYTKIGRMVYAAFDIDFASTSIGSHQSIGGLPFTSQDTSPNANGVAPDYQTYDVEDGPIYHVSKGGTNIILYKNNGQALAANNVSGKNLRGTAIYRT